MCMSLIPTEGPGKVWIHFSMRDPDTEWFSLVAGFGCWGVIPQFVRVMICSDSWRVETSLNVARSWAVAWATAGGDIFVGGGNSPSGVIRSSI